MLTVDTDLQEFFTDFEQQGSFEYDPLSILLAIEELRDKTDIAEEELRAILLH